MALVGVAGYLARDSAPPSRWQIRRARIPSRRQIRRARIPSRRQIRCARIPSRRQVQRARIPSRRQLPARPVSRPGGRSARPDPVPAAGPARPDPVPRAAGPARPVSRPVAAGPARPDSRPARTSRGASSRGRWRLGRFQPGPRRLGRPCWQRRGGPAGPPGAGVRRGGHPGGADGLDGGGHRRSARRQWHWLRPARTADPIIAQAIDGNAAPLDFRAPAFTLTDQYGRPASLAGLHGKVVLLTFLDPVCTSDCPVIAQSSARPTRCSAAVTRRRTRRDRRQPGVPLGRVHAGLRPPGTPYRAAELAVPDGLPGPAAAGVAGLRHRGRRSCRRAG